MSRRRKKNQERRRADDLLAAWQLERLEQDRALPLPALSACTFCSGMLI